MISSIDIADSSGLRCAVSMMRLSPRIASVEKSSSVRLSRRGVMYVFNSSVW